MNFTFSTATTITLKAAISVPATTVSATGIQLISMTDTPDKKTVVATLKPIVSGSSGPIGPGPMGSVPFDLVLWSGVDYDHIGDWTQDQANTKILSLLGV